MSHTLPLAGIKVLDLSRALSGPFCAMILGDLGAEVFKIEPLPGGDMVRGVRLISVQKVTVRIASNGAGVPA